MAKTAYIGSRISGSEGAVKRCIEDHPHFTFLDSGSLVLQLMRRGIVPLEETDTLQRVVDKLPDESQQRPTLHLFRTVVLDKPSASRPSSQAWSLRAETSSLREMQTWQGLARLIDRELEAPGTLYTSGMTGYSDDPTPYVRVGRGRTRQACEGAGRTLMDSLLGQKLMLEPPEVFER